VNLRALRRERASKRQRDDVFVLIKEGRRAGAAHRRHLPAGSSLHFLRSRHPRARRSRGRLRDFLREQGIDAQLDRPAAEQWQDWPDWMLRQIRAARFVLIIASPEYRRRAEGEALASEGRGVQWEARLIREEVYADYKAALNRFLPWCCRAVRPPKFRNGWVRQPRRITRSPTTL
jgi:hypothetical protein